MNPHQKGIVALIGNPNCGKTTLFNALTGSNQMVGNWPGVTVEHKEGLYTDSDGNTVSVIDLPGIYSLVAYSDDERVSRDYLLSGKADLILNVVDATNLERNLYLTMLLREMGLPMVVALNMWDLATERGVSLDWKILARHLGVPVIPVSAVNKASVQKLRHTLQDSLLNRPTPPATEWNDLPPLIAEACAALGGSWKGLLHLESMDSAPALQWVERMEQESGEAPQIWLAEHRYRAIGSILTEAQLATLKESRITLRLDKILLHRVLGLPLFLLAMYAVFWSTMHLGGAFIDFFDITVGALCVDGVRSILQALSIPNVAIIVLADGVGGGIQTLSTFIPLIFSLFFMLSLLEDSGYMARAAFLMDRFMRVLGLPGKAFVPLLVGFGCSVPAIMATRTLENRRDRVMTILMAPFMSCGAKLPVYALFAVAFFPGTGQNAVFLLYLAGILVAIGTGLLLKNSLLRGEPSRFVMELPPYHLPSPIGVLRHSWFRLKDFILRAGKILIVVMALLGTLNSIDQHGNIGVEPGEYSLLASAGLLVAPVLEPLGVKRENWPASVALFMGVFAKEIVVGTMNALYLQQSGQEEGTKDTQPASLLSSLQLAVSTTGDNLRSLLPSNSAVDITTETNPVFPLLRKNFSEGPMQVFAFLLFVLLYVPCVSATSAAARELGRNMTIFMVLYTTGLAWTLATLFYQLTKGHQIIWILIATGMLALGFVALKLLGRRQVSAY